jgi:hypothetical protein
VEDIRSTEDLLRRLRADKTGLASKYLADAQRGLILPLGPRQPAIPGTGGIADLSLGLFQMTPSEIAPPHRPAKQPKDVVAAYMTPSDVGLPDLPLSRIDEALRSIPLDGALAILSSMADYADRFAGSPEGQTRVAETFLPPPLSERAKAEHRRTGRVVFSSQLPLVLARRALTVCSQPADHAWNDLQFAATVRILGVLTLALVSALNVPQTPEEVALDISRAQHFSMKTSKWDYEDAHAVLFEALPNVPHAADLDRIVEGQHGCTLRSLWSVAALAGMLWANDQQASVQPILDSIDPRLKQAFLDLWSVRPAEAAAAWAATDVSSTPWDLSAFYKRPLIDFGPVQSYANAYMPVRTAFMVDKARLADTLWIAAELMAERQRKTLFSHVGAAFESVARHRVQGRFSKAQLLTEDDLKARRTEVGDGGVCDLVVVYPKEWIAFEFVRHTLTRRTLTDGDYGDLLGDLRAGAVEKLGQIDETVWRLLAEGDMGKPTRVFPVVVVGGQLSINPVTWEAILSAFAERPPKALTVDRRCMRPAILDLVDLRFAFAAADQLGMTLPQVLAKFLASDLATMPFVFWLVDAYPQVDPGRVVTMPSWITDAVKWTGLPWSSI